MEVQVKQLEEVKTQVRGVVLTFYAVRTLRTLTQQSEQHYTSDGSE